MSNLLKRSKKNLNNIWRVRDKFSQDFTFYQTINFYKFYQNQVTWKWLSKI